MVMEGKLEARNAYLREYANPEAGRAHFAASDPRLKSSSTPRARPSARMRSIFSWTAPRANAPAGSATAISPPARLSRLCGNTLVEKNFLENFILPDSVPNILPRACCPMCYPADSHDGTFIPNWAMWFVLQLEEYRGPQRGPGNGGGARHKVIALLEFFEQYRNSDGLLEKLPSWVFVEWSEANEFVQDVNYPSNMLYAGSPGCRGQTVRDRQNYATEAEKVRRAVRTQSYDGTFFVDNALRGKDGMLKSTRNRTETCQYYAFYLDAQRPQAIPSSGNVWCRNSARAGKRQAHGPRCFLSRPFIGNVLRLEVLTREGLAAQALEESRDYLLYMAERTGTLWEFHDQRASCNHGFASHTAHFLVRDILGLKLIDTVSRKAVLRLSDPGIEWCEGRIPSVDGDFIVKWWKEGGGINTGRRSRRDIS